MTLKLGALGGARLPKLGEHVPGVLDRVALRQRVGLLEQHLAGLVVDQRTLELVEPPSRPMTPRRSCPGVEHWRG
jgi:hypothetical protein